MLHSRLRPVIVLCALASMWLASRGLAGASVGLLFLTPALLLAVPLLAGRYLGAEHLSRVARTGTSRRRRPAAAGLLPCVWGDVLPRGGLLIAASLAVRPPPLVLAD
jgi:hypothetical protein